MTNRDGNDMESELHRKALDQVGHLLASYEAGKLSSQAFRIGVETIWAVLGGVVTLPEFQDLMHEANEALKGLPAETSTRVLVTGEQIALVQRTSEQVCIRTSGDTEPTLKDFHTDDEALAYVEVVIARSINIGFTEVTHA